VINVKHVLTDGLIIKKEGLLGLYAPGIALSIWLYVFAFGGVLSDLVLRFPLEARPTYLALLLALMLSSVISGWFIDKNGKAIIVTFIGLGLCGVIPLLAFFLNSSRQILFYGALVGLASGVGITGFRVYLANLTEVEERGRVVGGLLFISYFAILISKLLLREASLISSILFLSLISFAGASFYFKITKTDPGKKKVGVYGKTVQYFMISWLLFAGAYGVWNALVTPHPISLISNVNNVTFGLLTGIGLATAALVGGTAVDWIGRRRVIGFAFACLSIAYLFYGLFSRFEFFALLLELTAWGFVNAIFIFVVWGDIIKSYKGLFYGLAFATFFGGFILGEALADFLGPVPWSYVSIFTFGMLVFAIVPLYYADEPLPKEKVKLREMSSYMQDIKNLGK
jgi:MFS family permease